MLYEHACSSFSVSVSTNRAVAKVSAWWAPPIWIHQSFFCILSISYLETSTTKLTPHPNAFSAATNGFCIYCFLPTLVTSSSYLLIVSFGAQTSTDFVQHALSDIFRHKEAYVRIFASSVRGIFLSFSYFMVLIVFLIIIRLFFSELVLFSIIIPNLTSQLFFFAFRLF